MRLSVSTANPVQRRHDLLCGKPVALELTGAEWVRHRATVLVDDRVAAVFPSLILRPSFGTRLIFQVSVAIGVPVFARPVEEPVRRIPVTLQRGIAAAPGEAVAERDDVHEWAGEIGVVGAVWVEVETREWSGAHLIWNASRLFIVPIVGAVALQASDTRERGLREFSLVQHRRLPTRGERVASEECWIEGNTCLWREPFILGTFHQCQRSDVGRGLLQRVLDLRITRNLNFREGGRPCSETTRPSCVGVELQDVRFVNCRDTQVRRQGHLRAESRVGDQPIVAKLPVQRTTR